MLNYEMIFILPGTLGEEEVGPIVEKVRKAVADNGGKELTVGDMGKNRLSYPMKQIRYGYFQLAHFQAEAKEVVEIQKKLALLPELLRVLIQKYDAKKQKINKINYFSAETSVYQQPAEIQPEAVKEYRGREVKKEERVEKYKKPAEKVSLEEIDKKLDEILQMDVNV